MRSLLRRFVHLAAATALAAALLGVLSAGPHASNAWAQSPKGEPSKEELAAARQLFKEGLRLERRKQWNQALAKFERVAKVKLTPQVRFHTALCQEHLGRLVEAINGFELAEQEARQAGPKARQVEANAPKRAAALRDRIGFVHITITGTIRTSKILLDGKPVSEGLIDTDIPVDPGTHTIAVDTDHETVFEQDVTIKAQQVEAIELPIDDPEPPPEPPPGVTEDGPDEVTPDKKDEPSRTPAYVVGGLGLAVGVTGGIFWVLAQTTIEKVRPTCNKQDQDCDFDKTDTAEQGQTYATVGNVLVPMGSVALAAGVVIWFALSPSDDDDDSGDESSTEPSVAIVPTGTGVQLIGTF